MSDSLTEPEREAARLVREGLKGLEGTLEGFVSGGVEVHSHEGILEVICDYRAGQSERKALRAVRVMSKEVTQRTGVEIDVVPKCLHTGLPLTWN